mgnify:CR=1 FL=1
MSGPKRYSFPIGNDISGADVLRALHYIPGVQFRVENGYLISDVSNSAWQNGNNLVSLGKLVDEAKAEVRRNIEMLVKDKAKRKSNVASMISSLDEQAKREEEKIRNDIDKLQASLSLTGKQFITPFKTYSVEEEKNQIITLIEKKKKELDEVNKSVIQQKEELQNFLIKLDKTDEYEAYVKLIKKQPDGDLRCKNNENVSSLCSEIQKKINNLENFTNNFNKSYSNLKKAGLNEYIARLEQLSLVADPFSDDSTKLVAKIMDDINGEVAILKSQREMLANKKASLEEADSRIRALVELSELLKPIYINGSRENKDKIEAQEANTNLVNKIETLLEEYNNISYVPANKKAYIKSIRGSLRNVWANINKSILTQALYENAQELESIINELKVQDEKYKKYNKEEQRYYDLCRCLNIPEDKIDLIPSFEIAMNSDDGIDKSLNDLININKALQNEVNSNKRKIISYSIAAANEGRVVSFESNDDIARVTYLRPEAKGAIFDVQINSEGQTNIYPRGVILSNGRSICSKEQLASVHSSCAWAEDLNNTMKSVGFEDHSASELSDEIKQSMYNEQEFIRLNEEQSIFYLKRCGYTDSEIEEFGYEVETEIAEEHYEEENVISISKRMEIK